MTKNSTGPDSRVRHDWTHNQVRAIYELSIPQLILFALATHRAFHRADEVQACSLLSIKTGGCPENCSYCPQSMHYSTGLERVALMEVEEVLAAATRARVAGATRFCMGGAWRSAPSGSEFARVLDMVRGVRALGLEACCTLGMLSSEQAGALAGAGLTAYNHNLDTSRDFYGSIVTTRTYEERLQTLARVRQAGITVCCGGIIGMGESREDRCSLLQALATFDPHPESVPINLLVPVAGTPLGHAEPLDALELVRTVATARVLMPGSMVRLSAGRIALSDEAQALCFLAGANSIFVGERLLTSANPCPREDIDLLRRLGMTLSPQSLDSELQTSCRAYTLQERRPPKNPLKEFQS